MDPSVIQEAMEEESSNNLLVVLIMLVVIITILIVILYIFKDQFRKFFKKPTALESHVSKEKKKADKALQDIGGDPLPDPPKCSIKPSQGTCRSPMVKYKDVNGEDCCEIPEPTTGKETSAEQRLAILKGTGELAGLLMTYKVITHVAKKALLKNSKVARNLVRKTAIKAAKEGEKKALDKAIKKTGQIAAEETGKVAAKMELMAGCAALGPLGDILDGIMAIGFVADLLDSGGYSQYLSNKELILATRNYMDSHLYILMDVTTKNTDSIPTFTLDNIGLFKDLSKIDHKLKILYDSYHDARTMWQSEGMLGSALKNMSDDEFKKLLEDIKQGKPPTTLINAVKKSSDDPKVRSDFIWKHMTNDKDRNLNISNNDGDIVMYRPNLVSKHNMGITFNKQGADLFNKEVVKVAGYKEGVTGFAVYSKYYRKFDKIEKKGTPKEKFLMKQFALDDEYCFVSLSYGYIKHLCTDGYSKKELLDQQSKKASGDSKLARMQAGAQKFFDTGTTPISPKSKGLDYDADIGLCKYMTDSPEWKHTGGYCNYMGRPDDPEHSGTLPCEDGGCDKNTYKDCQETSTGEKLIEFIIPETIVGGYHRWTGDKGSGGADYAYHHPVKAVTMFFSCTVNPFTDC
jgi:hypothetical protein